MQHFGDIMFTDRVKAEQTRRGSRDAYARMTAAPAPDGLTEREATFIAARDSFYLSTVTETGWPYVQHRGGPKGFLKVLSPTKIGFADYRGNKQYVSTGNAKNDGRASLFLMDYPNRARLKLLAHLTIQDADENPDLATALAVENGGKVERLFTLDLEAYDWNCPQFITQRFTADDIRETLDPIQRELEALRAENAKLKAAASA